AALSHHPSTSSTQAMLRLAMYRTGRRELSGKPFRSQHEEPAIMVSVADPPVPHDSPAPPGTPVPPPEPPAPPRPAEPGPELAPPEPGRPRAPEPPD
ncbi:hypothetical protein AB0K74_46270, partial [Streptomyces sp. NPDC056159]|uniref:hypothetical protein n=1 Tax=Streptomyces sp. NPDC056159 TaxID=3155537 RepID=UPI00342BF7B6